MKHGYSYDLYDLKKVKIEQESVSMCGRVISKEQCRGSYDSLG